MGRNRGVCTTQDQSFAKNSLPSWPRWTAALAAAGLLAACGGPVDPVAERQGVVTGCPEIQVVADADSETVFREGGGRDLTDVVAAFWIGDFNGSCDYRNDSVDVELFLPLFGELGPAATSSDQSFDFLVAVADPTGEPIMREVFDTTITFPPDRTITGIRETIDLTIPARDAGQAQRHQIYISFVLTADQLAFNRSR